MSLLPVSEALARLFALVRPLGTERVPLTAAMGRVLAEDVVAGRDQPPFAAASMDGYAVPPGVAAGDRLRVVGEAAAGAGHRGRLKPGEAVRIFTGAPLPEGAERVVIQEDATRDGESVTLREIEAGTNVRPAGSDFREGDRLGAPRRLGPAEIALAAAMNHSHLTVSRRPVVAVLAGGDELVPPGSEPGPDQIIASNSYGLHALLTGLGAEPRLLPIAPDDADALAQCFELARGADLIVTIGGASVGDHDLIGPVTERLGMERAFYKVAMRPGKPLMAGRLGEAVMIGLPGNPVSALVCGHVFVAPVVRAMQGLPAEAVPTRALPLAAALPPNGPRAHYLRARLTREGVLPFERQDSALLTVLAEADALIVQPPHDPGRPAGASVEVVDLRER